MIAEEVKINWWVDEYNDVVNYCKEDFPKEVEKTIRTADKICQQIFTFEDKWETETCKEEVVFKDKVMWTFIPFGDPEWMYTLNRHTCFVHLGKAFQYTKNKKYVFKFEELIEHWINNVVFNEASESTTWRGLEVGIRCENWLKSLFLFKDGSAFSDSLRYKIKESLYEHGEYLHYTNDIFDELCSWGIVQNYGLFLVGVYFSEASWIEEAVSRLDREVCIQVFDDGTHWEQSPMYHCEVLHCLLNLIIIARRNDINLTKNIINKTYSMLNALKVWCKPNGHIPCQSDSDDIDVRDLFVYGAHLFNDGELRYLAGEYFDSELIWNLGGSAYRQYRELISRKPSYSSYALRDSGNYMVRNDFLKYSDYLKFHCGCIGSTHGHADQLHIDLFSGGEDILIDSGRYTYVNNALRKKIKKPSSHNTTTVDHMDFSESMNGWGHSHIAQPIKGEYRFTDEVDYLSGAHLGYINSGVFTSRKIIYIKPDIYVIYDVFYGKGTHTYQQYWHFNKGSVSCNNNNITYAGKNALVKMHCLKGKGELIEMNHSKTYNSLEKHFCFVNQFEKEGTASMVTVISTEKIYSPSKLFTGLIPIKLMRSGRVLSDKEAEAVCILKDSKEYIVLCCHEEIIDEVDLLCTGGYSGYGKVIVFMDNRPEGICLSW